MTLIAAFALFPASLAPPGPEVPHPSYSLVQEAPAGQQAAPPAQPARPAWEFAGSVYYSDPPNSEGHTMFVGTADRGPLHLELRYGYEDLETASIFAGWNFAVGGEVSAELTPMIGVVGGNTDGIAPALEADIGWKRIHWYTELEYLFDADDSDNNFFYSWSTLMFALTENLRAGVVTERSKIVDTDYDLQRGLAVEFAGRHVGFAVYSYNLGSDDSYTVASVGFSR